jgi:hypothetical protein
LGGVETEGDGVGGAGGVDGDAVHATKSNGAAASMSSFMGGRDTRAILASPPTRVQRGAHDVGSPRQQHERQRESA